MKRNLNLLLLLISFGLVIVSCDDDSVGDPPPPAAAVVTPEIDVAVRVADQDLVLGNTYMINETALQIDIAQFYMGNVTLAGDKTYSPDDYFIAGATESSFVLPDVDEGEYDFQFAIGVTPEINSLSEEDFTTRPAGDPLGLQNPSMHWSWATGYRFLRIDGVVDTDADGIVDTPVEYHLGSDAFFAILDSAEPVLSLIHI